MTRTILCGGSLHSRFRFEVSPKWIFFKIEDIFLKWWQPFVDSDSLSWLQQYPKPALPINAHLSHHRFTIWGRGSSSRRDSESLRPCRHLPAESHICQLDSESTIVTRRSQWMQRRRRAGSQQVESKPVFRLGLEEPLATYGRADESGAIGPCQSKIIARVAK